MPTRASALSTIEELLALPEEEPGPGISPVAIDIHQLFQRVLGDEP